MNAWCILWFYFNYFTTCISVDHDSLLTFYFNYRYIFSFYPTNTDRGTNKLEILAQKDFFVPGRYTIELPLHPPETFLLVLGMMNEHGQYFEDTVPVRRLNSSNFMFIKLPLTSKD